MLMFTRNLSWTWTESIILHPSNHSRLEVAWIWVKLIIRLSWLPSSEALWILSGWTNVHLQRLPFGYVNAPFEFLRALYKTLQPMKKQLKSQLVVYMDDILLLSNSQREHEEDLLNVLEALENDGWRLNADKSSFFQTKFNFLGLELSPQGWNPEKSSLKQLRDLPVPRTKKEWRSIKGWVNQLTRFILNGAHLTETLSEKRLQEVSHKVMQRYMMQWLKGRESLYAQFLIFRCPSQVTWRMFSYVSAENLFTKYSCKWRYSRIGLQVRNQWMGLSCICLDFTNFCI